MSCALLLQLQGQAAGEGGQARVLLPAGGGVSRGLAACFEGTTAVALARPRRPPPPAAPAPSCTRLMLAAVNAAVNFRRMARYMGVADS